MAMSEDGLEWLERLFGDAQVDVTDEGIEMRFPNLEKQVTEDLNNSLDGLKDR